jgi:hypothetical protein
MVTFFKVSRFGFREIFICSIKNKNGAISEGDAIMHGAMGNVD